MWGWLRVVATGSGLVPMLLLCALGQPAQAGTTGSLEATVVDEAGAPVSRATVAVSSSPQTASAVTDDDGRFTIISLAPGTYAIVVRHAGYEQEHEQFVEIEADQTRSARFVVRRRLKQIGSVTTTGAVGIVAPGVTGNLYSVGPALAAAAAPLGGGGNLANAYSALSAIPGAFVPAGQQGWGQALYVRGGRANQIGVEYDGVPVNRAFDNVASTTLTTLG
jgi:Carboxypeptidase regulatory-like domain/TonB-dependent Receptor Plug Domain